MAGPDVAAQTPAGLRELRSDVGYAFQHFNLAPRLTALTNVLTGGLHAAGPITEKEVHQIYGTDTELLEN